MWKLLRRLLDAEGGASDVTALPDDKKNELANAVAESKKVASKYDLTRLANTVEGYATKPNYIVKSALNMELIWCKPGSFIMGEGGNAHPVILTKGFYLGKYEVTQEQYEKVMGNNPSKFKGENLPVEHVTWDDAVAFCKELTQKRTSPSEVGSLLCPPRLNGSMPVEQERPRSILGEMK